MIKDITATVTLTVPLKEEGIIQFYDAVAQECGHDPAEIQYDCRWIEVSNDRFDIINAYYAKNGVDTLTIGMWWCVYGPKTNEKLSGEDVVVDLGRFFK